MRSSVDIRRMIFGVVVVCAFGLSAFGQPWAGSGTAEDPYQIWDACDMQAIGADSNYWDANFILCADINLGEYTGTSFNIIGKYSAKPFKGVFDGNCHTISNFTYDSNGVNYIGLFGYISDPNAELKNLYLVDPNVKAGTGYFVGSLVGYLGWCTVTGCDVEGGSISGNFYVGGLVGENGSDILQSYCSTSVSGSRYIGGMAGTSGGVISNCKSSGIVSGSGNCVGGLVGENYGNISDSNSTGSVDGGIYVGGLVGANYETISNCYSTGSVIGNEKVGGLVGINYGFVPASVTSSYSACSVTGTYEVVGGLVGRNEGYISNCYSTGATSGDFHIGGLVGRNYEGEVLNCYATGSVTGYEPYHTGGLIGDARPGATVRNSFWDVNSSGLDTSYGGIGKTTAEMQAANTFAGWSCAELWTIDEGVDYPHLVWENKPGQVLSEIQWYGGGSGTETEPYIIYTAEQMNRIGLMECDWDRYFKLGADIDLSIYTGESFNMIGYIRPYGYNGFAGIFDGNGRTVSNFTYNSTGKNYMGIFEFVGDANAEVKNLGLISPDVNAGSGVIIGSLIGFFAYGTVSACYVEGGSVLGNSTVGGLIGRNYYGVVSNSYSAVGVSGNNNVGGLVGSNYMGSIANCYVAGDINGMGSLGGLVGDDDNGSYTKSFWDVNVNPDVNGIGNVNDPNVIGKTTAEMQTESTFTDAGWDFVGEVVNGPNDIWGICEGTNYPKFVWQIPIGDFVCPDGVTFADYSVFGAAWLSDPNYPNWDPNCDISEPNDNVIDERDLAVFCENWLVGI
ncbi:MAG: hypothetical protein AMJ43_10490 [Coxiella sp. DG_40]|nr:MAG: hypothetical protein AMJ43_10490 [Coxiella sp. DG_40]